eukprot:TRINITY_DN9800_c0_g1_i2.p1 TRINITY_DN9800_c0_g1~~TRINITY_DN9800_c0_g1_i2.p1  ORF type:complete len:164 (-),score=24.64 TRINITY_DN9800_c0_g1_i2:81-572(-)
MVISNRGAFSLAIIGFLVSIVSAVIGAYGQLQYLLYALFGEFVYSTPLLAGFLSAPLLYLMVLCLLFLSVSKPKPKKRIIKAAFNLNICSIILTLPLLAFSIAAYKVTHDPSVHYLFLSIPASAAQIGGQIISLLAAIMEKVRRMNKAGIKLDLDDRPLLVDD